MVVIMKIGRKLPRNWFKQAVTRTAQFLTFQENMWIIIGQAFKMSKKECEKTEKNTVMDIQCKDENDTNPKWKWEWKIIKISSVIPSEEEEYYKKLGSFYERVGAIKNNLNKEFEQKADLSKAPDSKVMSESEFKRAKEAGFGALNDISIAKKLVDMGIVTDLQWHRDKTMKIDRIVEDPLASKIEASTLDEVTSTDTNNNSSTI